MCTSSEGSAVSVGCFREASATVESGADQASEISSIIHPPGRSLGIPKPQLLHLSNADNTSVCSGFN